MNILFILTNYPGFGGIEKVTNYITSFLINRYNITILAYGTNQPSLIDMTLGSFHLEYMPEPYAYASLKNTDFLRSLLNTNDYDFVVLQDSYAPIEHIFSEINFPWKKKLIVVEHNDPMHAIRSAHISIDFSGGVKNCLRGLKTCPLNLLKKVKRQIRERRRHTFLLNICGRYVLLSESFRKDLLSFTSIFGGGEKNHIKSISNPLTISRPSRDYSNGKKKQILFVGRLMPQKGLKYLLPIWKEFSKTNTEGWELVILGDGPERGYVETYIAKERLENIRIDAPTTNVECYYEESAILVMTSLYEGFGLVLTEAMSRNCVPIAFDSFSAVHDIIESEKNGILVQPFDIQEYVSQLNQLTHNDERLKILSKTAIEIVDKFDIEVIGNQWIEMFEELSH